MQTSGLHLRLCSCSDRQGMQEEVVSSWTTLDVNKLLLNTLFGLVELIKGDGG